jgi:type IV pilus assembly protein PilB
MLREFDYENMPVADIVNEIIIDAVKRGASDIHFDPRPEYLMIRIRIDGELVDYTTLPLGIKNHVTTKIKILAGMNITESRLPQDGAIKTTIEDKSLDLRVSTLPIVYGEKVVIRILDYTKSMEGLETLGFSETSLEKLKKIISNPNGIILVTGATGTGKSTTVYSILDRLNTKERNIITVEDPVEMKIEGVNQVQAQSEIGLTFAAALRSILRQDPDTIMIGEIRDDETARIAIRAAITGHLVLSTIHTNNSLNTIERLLDMDVERYLLGSALTGIVSQRLTKKLCPKCRTSRNTTPYEKNIFKKTLGINVDSIYEPVGCDECYKGYKGRIAIQEVLAVTQDVRDAILNNTRKDKLREIIYKKGKTTTLLQDGLEKVINGLTSFDEVLRVIEVDNDFGEDEQDIKDAIIGRDTITNNEKIETLDL